MKNNFASKLVIASAGLMVVLNVHASHAPALFRAGGPKPVKVAPKPAPRPVAQPIQRSVVVPVERPRAMMPRADVVVVPLAPKTAVTRAMEPPAPPLHREMPAAVPTRILPGAARGGVETVGEARPQIVVAGSIPAEAGLLGRAYALMAAADHDYQGHRAKAMRHAAAAGRFLGMTLGGNGRGGEPQGASDFQMAQARAALERVLALANANGQGAVMRQVEAAINQVSMALIVR